MNFGSFTVISPFLSGFATAKGIPLWVVGLSYSVVPFFTLLASYWAGKYMIYFGRASVLILGNCLIAIGSASLYLFLYLDTNQTILVLFISRVVAGSGFGLFQTAGFAILQASTARLSAEPWRSWRVSSDLAWSVGHYSEQACTTSVVSVLGSWDMPLPTCFLSRFLTTIPGT